MTDINKPIHLSEHAKRYINRRGFTPNEVHEAITCSTWTEADYGKDRFQCSHEFYFGQIWNGKRYETKCVRPIFVEEETEIVVVTVYTYYY
jgi:hypothetical protein